jgi:hypothetical protein
MKEKKTLSIFTGHLKFIFERVNGSESIRKNVHFFILCQWEEFKTGTKLANILFLVSSGGNHSLKLQVAIERDCNEPFI